MGRKTVKKFTNFQKASQAATQYGDFFQSEATLHYERGRWIIRFDKFGQFLATDGTLTTPRVLQGRKETI